jgi:hypothetical protein
MVRKSIIMQISWQLEYIIYFLFIYNKEFLVKTLNIQYNFKYIHVYYYLYKIIKIYNNITAEEKWKILHRSIQVFWVILYFFFHFLRDTKI